VSKGFFWKKCATVAKVLGEKSVRSCHISGTFTLGVKDSNTKLVI